jgi:hypothetical protein
LEKICIGRGGPIPWPARSPDLTPPDFFLWGAIKERVFRERPTAGDNMRERLTAAFREFNDLNVQAKNNIFLRKQVTFNRKKSHQMHQNGVCSLYLLTKKVQALSIME